MDDDVYRSILAASRDIDLPAEPDFLESERAFAEEIMRGVESEIGEAAASDYYTTSRARFLVMVMLAKRHVTAHASGPAKILDVGSAPGFLGLALHRSGLDVSGINFSDKYLDVYPTREIAALFKPQACDIEKQRLPFDDGSLDAIVFTEVLEHISIRPPHEILAEFRRVLRDGGVVLFSTPNVSNLSNLIALMKGTNVFWPVDMFFGSTDRHNREFTPGEAKSLFLDCGFTPTAFFGANDHANWRFGTQDEIYSFMATNPPGHPLLRNTTVGVFTSGG